MRSILVAVLALGLASCGPTVVYRDRIKTVNVPVRAPCPEPNVYKAIKDSRPRPLRETAMPATAEERTAKTAAQLGKYEAEGGWGDRAMGALDRCQEGLEIPE